MKYNLIKEDLECIYVTLHNTSYLEFSELNNIENELKFYKSVIKEIRNAYEIECLFETLNKLSLFDTEYLIIARKLVKKEEKFKKKYKTYYTSKQITNDLLELLKAGAYNEL